MFLSQAYMKNANCTTEESKAIETEEEDRDLCLRLLAHRMFDKVATYPIDFIQERENEKKSFAVTNFKA